MNAPMTITLRGAAGGAGGGSDTQPAAAQGGGCGAVTTGTTVQVFPNATYTLVVGSGGGGGADGADGVTGGETTLVNTTSGMTHLRLGGGRGGAGSANGGTGGGQGGTLAVGASGISGGQGGAAGTAGVNGGPGAANPNGAGGGGGGSAATNGIAGNGGAGGGPTGGAGGGGGSTDETHTASIGTNNGGLAGGPGGIQADYRGGGGAGGGGGAQFTGVGGAYGGGGGGASGGDVHLNGGAGQGGVAIVWFVNGCTYMAAPVSTSLAALASAGNTFAMASPTDCPWTATSGASWLTITSGAAGAGDGTVTYSATANATGAVRTAMLTLGGQTVMVTQSAIDHVVITPATSSIAFLGSQALTAQAFDVNNSVIPNVTFTWTSANAAVATVTSTSIYSASATSQRTGAATITASPVQGPSATATVTVTPGPYLVYDNFNFSGYLPGHVPNVSALGVAWQQDAGTWSYTNGSALMTEGGGGWTLNTIDSGAADIDLSVDWTPASPGGVYAGLAFRMTDVSNYYGLVHLGGAVYLMRVRQGVATQLAGVTADDPRGQTIHVSVQAFDDSIVVKFNDNAIMSVVDGFNITAARHGVLWNSTSDPFSFFDNFRVTGALPPAVATLTLNAPATTLFVDYSETVTATALDTGSNPVSGAAVRFASSNPMALTRVQTGALTAAITAREIGTSLVTATAPRGPAAGASFGITASACVDPLTATSATAMPTGSTGTITVTAAGTCGWNARAEADWITIAAGSTGTGSRTVTYVVDGSPGGTARAGTIFLGGRRLTVTQQPLPCTYSVWPATSSWAGAGGSAGFDIATASYCSWSVITEAGWVHITNGDGNGSTASGIGSGTVTLTVDANSTTAQRSALIGGEQFNFSGTQAAAGAGGGGGSGGACVTAIAPPTAMFGSSGGLGTATVSAGSACSWSASSSSNWIVVNTNGTGNGSVTFSVAANAGSGGRTATLVIGDRVAIVSQQGDNGCAQPNGNDTEDDTAAIQCLLDAGGTVTLDADVLYGYRIGPHPATGKGLVLATSGTTLTSTSAYGYRALLIAQPALRSPILQIDSAAVSAYTIEKTWFYGNKFNRSCDHSIDIHENVNVRLRGGPFVIDDVESDAAVCGSGMIVDVTTHDFEIKNSWFAFNGFPHPNPGHDLPEGYLPSYSDGLTVHACVDGHVHDNHFLDNSDVDLIFGGTRRDELGRPNAECHVSGNHITHIGTYGFAGLMIGWFGGATQLTADHTGAEYVGNTVSSEQDMLAFGVMVGHHPWDPAIYVTNGVVHGNSSTGANVNLAVDGADRGSVQGNVVPTSRGTVGYFCTAVGADYAAFDFGSTELQSGFVLRRFHRNDCVSR